MDYAFYLGADVTDDDQATLSLIEKATEDENEEATYHVRDVAHVEAEPGEEETFDALVDRVQNLVAESPYTGRTVLVVNRTSERGRALLEAFNERGLTPIGVALTGGAGAAQEGSGLKLEGGDRAARDESGFYVSEYDLVGHLDDLQREGRLKWEENTEEVSKVARGIESYRARVDAADAEPETTRQTEVEQQEEPPRAEAHDTHVVSAALACWLGEEHTFDPTEHLKGDPPTTGEAKRMIRPDTTS